MKAEEFLKQATKGTEAGEIIEESHLRLAIIALLDNYREVLVKECSIPNVSHSYYQVVLNGANDDIEEVTSALPTLERAKKALEANKAHFDEEMYIIAKINCG